MSAQPKTTSLWRLLDVYWFGGLCPFLTLSLTSILELKSLLWEIRFEKNKLWKRWTELIRQSKGCGTVVNRPCKYFINWESPDIASTLYIQFISVKKKMKTKCSELKTLEWDILNTNYLIWVSNGHTFDFLPKPFFLGYIVEKNQNPIFKIFRIQVQD